MFVLSLKDHIIKTEYRSLIDNVVQDFYLPLLNEANQYDRAVGFFSSSALVEVSKGISSIAKKKGSIRIIASPYLSDEDMKAIEEGYERRDIIEKAVLRQVDCESTDYFSLERLNLLSNLIANNVLNIRIAITNNSSGIGMYHEKMGIITDENGDRVAFSGSMNESATAMSINYETIDVFTSWNSIDDNARVNQKVTAFESIWRNTEPNIEVMEFDSISKAIIKKYRHGEPNLHLDQEQYGLLKEPTLPYNKEEDSTSKGARAPEDIVFRDYQKEAVANWIGDNYRGIFDMATGTGKTFTGLLGISKLSENLKDHLAVFIVCPYQHLVEQWVEDIENFNMKPIIGYSSSSQKDWKQRLSKAIRDQKIREDKPFFCFVCTNATFKSCFVQNEMEKIKASVLLVVDEAHNFGGRSYLELLDDRFDYRMALSATMDRHGDEEGTEALYKFFGEKCIEYPLEQAIKEDKLTPYRYYPIVVHLNEDELSDYEQLSFKISKCVIKTRMGKYKLNKQGEILAMKRARIVAGAQEKLDALRTTIQPFKNDNNILVYCGATNVKDEDADYTEENAEDIRQIEAVTRILGVEEGMNVAKFTSMENIDERSAIKEHFTNGTLQAIVAIKCLDEGVNIPGIKTAFILASTTNPKEYIQRRGRVLRKAEGKEYAQIFDFVTLPRPLDNVLGLTKEQANRDLTLVKNELNRIEEFGRLSLNIIEAESLMWKIKDTYHIDD